MFLLDWTLQGNPQKNIELSKYYKMLNIKYFFQKSHPEAVGVSPFFNIASKKTFKPF